MTGALSTEVDALARSSRRAALVSLAGFLIFGTSFGLAAWRLTRAEAQVAGATAKLQQLEEARQGLLLSLDKEKKDLTQLYQQKAALEASIAVIGNIKKEVDDLRGTLVEAQSQSPKRGRALGEALRHANSIEDDLSRAKAELVDVPKAVARPRSDYSVGLNTVGVPDGKRQELNAGLQKEGYALLLDHSVSYQQRPAWFADRSTVLFYRNSAEPAAKELAAVMTKLTGSRFRVARGGGLGVPQGREDVTIFVHVLPR